MIFSICEMVEDFDKTLDLFRFFHKNEISIKMKGLYSLNKLGGMIDKSAAVIINWKLLVMLSTKCYD